MNVAAINIRTYVNPATHANEVLAMSVMTMSQVPLEGPTADWRVAPKGGFVAATKLDGRPLPPGVEAQAAAAKLPLHVQPSERALLGFVLAKLQMLGEWERTCWLCFVFLHAITGGLLCMRVPTPSTE